ncbi:MAG: polymerase, sigma-24 subunit, subfamily [Frankiales bacterium]|nr:polymerase, sigma-24 subunit, subfamily [Frankiales bacterium]
MSTTTTEDAVADLYAASCARLVGIVTLAAGSRAEAEECVQEAFIQLLRRWQQVSRYDDPEAWVRAVAFRLLSNRRRKARNGIRAVLRHGTPDDTQAPTGDRIDVMRALQQLPLTQRQVVVLHYLNGMAVDDVARTLEVAPGTVKSRLSRARDTLAPLLREETFHA